MWRRMRSTDDGWGMKKILQSLIDGLRRYSIYKRLLVIMLAIIITTNFTIGMLSYTVSSRGLDKSISQSTRQVLSDLVATLDETFSRYEGLATQISINAQLRSLLLQCRELRQAGMKSAADRRKYDGYKQQIETTLFQMAMPYNISDLEIVSDFDDFGEVDYTGAPRGGRVVDSAAYRSDAKYRQAAEAAGSPVWFDTTREQGSIHYEDSKTLGLPNYLTMLESIPNFGEQGPLGVILITFSCYTLNNSVNLNNMYDPEEVLFLASPSGIISILNGTYLIHGMPGDKVLQRIAEARDGTLTAQVAGKTKLFIFKSFGRQTNFFVVYMASKDSLYRSIAIVRNIIIGITLLCICLAVILAYLVTASISQPLQALEKTMQMVGGNRLDLQYHDDHKDEISVLGAQFNLMLGQIRNLLDHLTSTELSRKNEELKRKEAEFDSLQLQIDPHFLYNTLDIIRWNAIFEEKGEGKVSRMLAEFSTLLRFNTSRIDKLVDLRMEINHAQSYVKVINFKTNFRIRLAVEVPEELLRCLLPKLVLQPLVENAALHGSREDMPELLVAIRAAREGGLLTVEVRDNGAGIAKDRLEVLNQQLRKGKPTGRSIGLRNISERIRLRFGDAYGLSLQSEAGLYTAAVLRLPVLFEQGEPGTEKGPENG